MNGSETNIFYIGTLLPRAGAVLEMLLRAIARLRARRPEVLENVRFHFVGTSNQPDGRNAFAVLDRARAAGVLDLVAETPQRVAYLEALALLGQAHGVLLIGSDEPHYTASKIYPGILSGRPLLGIFHQASSAPEILRKCGGALVYDFATAADLTALTVPVAQGLETLLLTPESLPARDQQAFAPYTAEQTSRAFAELFDDVLRNKPVRHP